MHKVYNRFIRGFTFCPGTLVGHLGWELEVRALWDVLHSQARAESAGKSKIEGRKKEMLCIKETTFASDKVVPAMKNVHKDTSSKFIVL